MKVFSGNSNRPLARSIASAMEVPLSEASVSSFPDGETSVQIEESTQGEDVYVVQSISPPADKHLMELLIMLDALQRGNAASVNAIIPYYGYARQDRRDKDGAPITAKLVANLLMAAGADCVFTMDPHASQIQGFFDVPVEVLSPMDVAVSYLKKQFPSNLVVASPDAGGIKRAQAYAQALDCNVTTMIKQRISSKQVESLSVVGDVARCNVVIVDDVVSTGATLLLAARTLRDMGAKSIKAFVTHALIDKMAPGISLKQAGITELITTDSVIHPYLKPGGVRCTEIPVGDLFAAAAGHGQVFKRRYLRHTRI